MKKWEVFLVLLSMLLPALSFAWSGYSSNVTLLTVYQAGQASWPGVLSQFPSTLPPDTEGCARSGQGYAWIDFSSTAQPDGKALYATVLSAYLAGKMIGIGVNGCSSLGYPLVYGINVYP